MKTFESGVKTVKLPQIQQNFPTFGGNPEFSFKPDTMRKLLSPTIRTFLVFPILFLCAFKLQAQRAKEVLATAKEVTVFLQRAQVFSTANTSISSGTTELAVVNVPSNLDP